MSTIMEPRSERRGAPVDLLDRTHDRLRGGAPHRAMRELFSGLLELRRELSDDEWKTFSQQTALDHPLREQIHRDPMTSRSFQKPRGYAGDAVLLDYIYGIRIPEDATPVGRAIYDYASGRAAACAVRHRRALLAHAIDRAADAVPGGAHVLSIACGHLREAELSSAMRRGWIERFVAMDADRDSLAEVSRQWGDRVETMHASIARWMARAGRGGQFDLVYSAGLYDYLEPAVAKRLTKTMFEVLRPGGRLIVSNFLPQVADAGYMETYMGWELIYRTKEELATVAADIDRGAIASLRSHEDPFQGIAYLEATRR